MTVPCDIQCGHFESVFNVVLVCGCDLALVVNDAALISWLSGTGRWNRASFVSNLFPAHMSGVINTLVPTIEHHTGGARRAIKQLSVRKSAAFFFLFLQSPTVPTVVEAQIW